MLHADNRIGDDGGCALAHGLRHNSALTQLIANHNCMGDEALRMLACVVAKGENASLLEIDLGANRMHDVDALKSLHDGLLRNKRTALTHTLVIAKANRDDGSQSSGHLPGSTGLTSGTGSEGARAGAGTTTAAGTAAPGDDDMLEQELRVLSNEVSEAVQAFASSHGLTLGTHSLEQQTQHAPVPSSPPLAVEPTSTLVNPENVASMWSPAVHKAGKLASSLGELKRELLNDGPGLPRDSEELKSEQPIPTRRGEVGHDIDTAETVEAADTDTATHEAQLLSEAAALQAEIDALDRALLMADTSTDV